MKIYTRKGDDGCTSLSGGKRVPKFHPRVEAFGSVDELIAWIGHLRAFKENESRKAILLYIQDQLMRCSATLADETVTDSSECFMDKNCITFLENEIDKIESTLPPLSNFIFPGGHILVSDFQITRCVCRRAERAVLQLNNSEKIPEIVYKFLNRLSDYLFVLSRQTGLELDIQEVTWSV